MFRRHCYYGRLQRRRSADCTAWMLFASACLQTEPDVPPPQIPRLYAVYKEQGIIENFEQMLDNIFVPLFEVTKDPASHLQLHLFLKQARARVDIKALVLAMFGLGQGLWHGCAKRCCDEGTRARRMEAVGPLDVRAG